MKEVALSCVLHLLHTDTEYLGLDLMVLLLVPVQ